MSSKKKPVPAAAVAPKKTLARKNPPTEKPDSIDPLDNYDGPEVGNAAEKEKPATPKTSGGTRIVKGRVVKPAAEKPAKAAKPAAEKKPAKEKTARAESRTGMIARLIVENKKSDDEIYEAVTAKFPEFKRSMIAILRSAMNNRGMYANLTGGKKFERVVKKDA